MSRRARAVVDPRFSDRLREIMDERGISYRALAARTHYSKSYLHDFASGRRAPTVEIARRLDEATGAGGRLLTLVEPAPADAGDDEIAALELSRRVAVSDVSAETLGQIEAAVDELATAYAATPPEELLRRVRRHLTYVGRLVEVRSTIDQRRRLLVAAGWLSLLAGTTHIDLRQPAAAAARLRTAALLGEHARHREIEAWCLETRAWDKLTDGDYHMAVDLSQRAQAVAPKGSSVHIQATAQEGRAWARQQQRTQTRQALDRVARLTSSLAVPDRPEHHYRYDPDKGLSYTATTLAWAGDPAAEEYARTLIRQLEAPDNGVPRPRRVASARLDLALALVASGSPDEGASEAAAAIASGRVVPSNWWRATEVLGAVERLGVRQATDLREVYAAHRLPGTASRHRTAR